MYYFDMNAFPYVSFTNTQRKILNVIYSLLWRTIITPNFCSMHIALCNLYLVYVCVCVKELHCCLAIVVSFFHFTPVAFLFCSFYLSCLILAVRRRYYYLFFFKKDSMCVCVFVMYCVSFC